MAQASNFEVSFAFAALWFYCIWRLVSLSLRGDFIVFGG